MEKIAIFVHASENELARALHALLYAQELHETGHEVKVVFDGAGTVWVKKFEDKENNYHPVFAATKNLGVITGACEYCAGVFGVTEDVQQAGLASLGESNGHPSLSKFVAEGYQMLII